MVPSEYWTTVMAPSGLSNQRTVPAFLQSTSIYHWENACLCILTKRLLLLRWFVGCPSFKSNKCQECEVSFTNDKWVWLIIWAYMTALQLLLLPRLLLVLVSLLYRLLSLLLILPAPLGTPSGDFPSHTVHLFIKLSSQRNMLSLPYLICLRNIQNII